MKGKDSMKYKTLSKRLETAATAEVLYLNRFIDIQACVRTLRVEARPINQDLTHPCIAIPFQPDTEGAALKAV
jgi:hypothetical protein